MRRSASDRTNQFVVTRNLALVIIKYITNAFPKIARTVKNQPRIKNHISSASKVCIRYNMYIKDSVVMEPTLSGQTRSEVL